LKCEKTRDKPPEIPQQPTAFFYLPTVNYLLNCQLLTVVLPTANYPLQQGKFEANLGGNVFKKRIRFEGQGKSGSGRTILCYKKGERIVFVHGFAKYEKSNFTSSQKP